MQEQRHRMHGSAQLVILGLPVQGELELLLQVEGSAAQYLVPGELLGLAEAASSSTLSRYTCVVSDPHTWHDCRTRVCERCTSPA